jgi:hypothetical protein
MRRNDKINFNKEIMFLGKICSHGHEYIDISGNKTGKCLRYLKGDHNCVECDIQAGKKYQQSEKGKKTSKKARKKFYTNNRNKVKKSHDDFMNKNPGINSKYSKNYRQTENGKKILKKHRDKARKKLIDHDKLLYPGDCNIYFITEENCEEYIKIGHTKHPTERISKLQMGNPRKIKLIGVIANANYDLELELHMKFEKDRCVGEWFKYTDEIKNWLKENDNKLIKE